MKMPMLVESSSSRARKYGMPAREARMPDMARNKITMPSASRKLNPVMARRGPKIMIYEIP